MTTPDQAARLYIEAKEAVEAAEAAKEAAESTLKLAYATAGIEMTVVDGVKVSLTKSYRSTYSVEILSGLIKASIFKKVTKVVVDGDKLRAAVKTELIAEDVADAATSKTEYTRIMVTPVSAQSKSADRASVEGAA